jgi:hypothetical protein
MYVCEICGRNGESCAHSLTPCPTCTVTQPGQACFGCGRVQPDHRWVGYFDTNYGREACRYCTRPEAEHPTAEELL